MLRVNLRVPATSLKYRTHYKLTNQPRCKEAKCFCSGRCCNQSRLTLRDCVCITPMMKITIYFELFICFNLCKHCAHNRSPAACWMTDRKKCERRRPQVIMVVRLIIILHSVYCKSLFCGTMRGDAVVCRLDEL